MTDRARAARMRGAAAATALVSVLAMHAVSAPAAQKPRSGGVSLTAATTTQTTTSTTTQTTTQPKATPKPQPKPITGSLGGGARFPQRALVLSVPGNHTVTTSQVHVLENGSPVRGLTLTPLTQPGPGDLGVVVVVDQSKNMAGAPIQQEMTAVRALAAQRTGNEQLGVITFDATANTILPLTSDPQTINTALKATPWIGPGTHILPALQLALSQLANAHLAVGGVILLSDGVDSQRGGKLTPDSIAALAKSIAVSISAVGLKDSSYSPGIMQQLAQLGGGKFVPATGSQLGAALTNINDSLTGQYLVRYRSQVAAGQPVTVSARIDGAPGSLTLGYQTHAPARVLPHRAPHPAAPAQPTLNPLAVRTDLLSPVPAFAPPVKPALPQARRSFWTSSQGAVVATGGFALLIGLAVSMLLLRLPGRGALQSRVSSFIPGATKSTAVDLGLSPEAGGRLARLLERRKWWPGFVEQVEVARMKKTPVEVVKRGLVIATVLALLFSVGAGTVLAGMAVLIVCPFIIKSVVGRAARKSRARYADQLPSHLQDLAGAMRAGRSFIGGLSAVAESADEPIKGEFERVAADEQLGLPLEEGLEGVARRMQSEDTDQLALIAALHRRSGSNVAESLDRVADGARDRADLGRELKALTGQAKLSSIVLSGLPVVMLVMLNLIAPAYAHPLFHTTIGMVLLGLSVVMVFSGWKIMNRITRVEP